jgi:hypothetical protein
MVGPGFGYDQWVQRTPSLQVVLPAAITRRSNMPTTTRPAGRWFALLSSVVRRRLALALAPPIALFGVLAAPAVPVLADYTCHYSHSQATITVTEPGGTFRLTGQEFAGYYSGNTVQPSPTGVTAAGKEAQCLLLAASQNWGRSDFNPGHIDGIFGPHSQAAAKAFQSFANSETAALTGRNPRISVDGAVGPQTWPLLRFYS